MRLPNCIIPALVLLALFAGYGLRQSFTNPTTEQTFSEGHGRTVRFVVDGLRCRGTGMFFTSLYEDTPGVLSVQTFAGEKTAVIQYDVEVITPEEIQEIMEAPIPFTDGTTSQVFTCRSVHLETR